MIRPHRLVIAAAAALAAVLAAAAPSAKAQASGSQASGAQAAHDHSHDHAPAAAPVASLASDRVLGRADAPVTVIEYASLTCIHCAAWANQVLPAFKTRFIDTGQVRLIYRDLPTGPAEVAVAAAKLTRCVAPERAFDVIERLMAQQATARSLNYPTSWFANAAALGGRPAEEVIACVQDPATQTAFDADLETARAAGVRGTPTFFVNGVPFGGEPTVDGLATAIEPLLAAR